MGFIEDLFGVMAPEGVALAMIIRMILIDNVICHFPRDIGPGSRIERRSGRDRGGFDPAQKAPIRAT